MRPFRSTRPTSCGGTTAPSIRTPWSGCTPGRSPPSRPPRPWRWGRGATIGIPTWLYGHEPPTPLATSHAKYLDNSIREDGLLAVATSGIVFVPGRAGTLQEVFQDAAQNYYRSVADRFSPMVFVDLDGFWTEDFGVKRVLDRLFDDGQEAMVRYVTTAEEAVAAIVELNGG